MTLSTYTIVKIVVFVIGLVYLPISFTISFHFLPKPKDLSIHFDVETMLVPLPSSYIIKSVHYTPSGNILILSSNESEKYILGIMDELSSNYHEIYFGKIDPIYLPSNGIRILPFSDNSRILLGDYILECKSNLDECTPNSSQLIPIIFPPEITNNEQTQLVWSEVIPSPDLNHIAWTTLILPTGAIDFIADLNRTDKNYTLSNIQIISSLSFTENSTEQGYLRVRFFRGGEVKQFVRGGSAITLAGSTDIGLVRSVIQDFSDENFYWLSHEEGYEESFILSPDEQLATVMSTRNSPNTSFAILSHLPVPYSALYLFKLNRAIYTYAIQGVRQGIRKGNIGPVLVEVEKSINDPNYHGFPLNDKDDEYVFRSPMSWNLNSTRAIWPEQKRGNSSSVRIRMLKVDDWIPKEKVSGSNTPNQIPYAKNISALESLTELVGNGKIAGKVGGYLELKFTNSFSAEAYYNNFSDDGKTFYNGEVHYKHDLMGTNLTKYSANVKMTGQKNGEEDFVLIFYPNYSLCVEPDEFGIPKSHGHSSYNGTTLKVSELYP